MILATEKIKTMSFDELYKLLMPTLREIGKEYSYISSSNTAIDNWLKKIVEGKYKKIINSDKITSINFSTVVRKNINYYLRKKFAEGKGLELFNRYIDKNIKVRDTPQNSLKKIVNFFDKFNYYPNSEDYLTLLNNERVNQILAKIVEDKKYLLGKMAIENLFDNDISISFVENYCISNNISIIQYDDNDSENINDNLSECFALTGLPLLTEEEKINLLAKVKQGDKRARDIMVERNLRLVAKVALKYKGRGVELEDLIQEGSIGLMKAIDMFDLEKGCKFSTYAVWWIRQKIIRSIYDIGRTIRVPVGINEKKNKIKKTITKLEKELGREPTNEELAIELKISPEKIKEILRVTQAIISINQKVDDDSRSELVDFIEDTKATNPEKIAVEKVWSEEIQNTLSILDERQRQIITLHFGLDGDKTRTLQEIGEIMGITRERVRQIEAEAIKKLGYKMGKWNDKKIISKKVNIHHITTVHHNSYRSRDNIYDYFCEYSKEEVEKVIEGLGERALTILHMKYGEDLANPVLCLGKLTKKDDNYLKNIFLRITRRLEKQRAGNTMEETSSDEEIVIPCKPEERLLENTNFDKEITQNSELKIESENNIMDEYVKILEIFNKDEFKELTRTKSIKEMIILSLAFGYVDDKYFFADSIANFFGMEQEEVTTVIKNGVVEYKEKLNEIIDKSIDKMVEPKRDNNHKVYVKALNNK